MSNKRPRLHEDEDEESLPVRRERKRPKKRSRLNDLDAPRPSTGVNHIKHKMRDIRRTLERSENLPADVRVEKERALAGYKQDLEKSEYEKRKKRMTKKYHMVRFFERQKATRRLKRLKTRLSKTDRESEEQVDLKNKIHRAEVDLNYALYCPLAEKYTSLYKNKEDAGNGDINMSNDSMISQGSEALVARPPMWSTIEKCMANGTLQALRDGKLGRGVANKASNEESAAPKRGPSQHTKKSKPHRSSKGKITKSSLLEAENDLSDEGFFD